MHAFFTKHPESVGETYWQHMGVALSFAGALFYAAFAALVHAFFPALCEKTASNKITALHTRMVTKRRADLTDSAESAKRGNTSKDGQFDGKMPENAR
jgi:hypothetical protein